MKICLVYPPKILEKQWNFAFKLGAKVYGDVKLELSYLENIL